MIKINTLYGLTNISDCYYVTEDRDIINRTIGKVKTQTMGKHGYYYVSLNEKGTNRQVKVTVHKIIALAFIRNAPYEVINHIDGDKTNNDVSNLEFCSSRENAIHAWKHHLITRKERTFIVEFLNYSVRGTMKELHNETGISRGTLYDLFYKKKGSKQHGIKQIVEVTDDKGQETIEMVSTA